MDEIWKEIPGYEGYTFSFIERSTTIENTTREVGSE